MRDVVVGAGIGGLTAAIRLASAGRPVLVLEAGDRPGGKADVVTVDGVSFDTGPSLLTLPHVFDDVLRGAGTSLRDEVELLAPDPAFRYVWPDGTVLDVHHAIEDTLASVDHALGSRARGELAAFLAYSAKIWEASADTFVLADAPSLGGLARLGPKAWAGLATIDAHRSMMASLRSRVSEPHLRDLLARYATYNGSDPRRAPATLHCIAHVELTLGGYGVRGGIGALVAALTRVAERLGVEIRCGSPVERLVVEGGRVVAVEAGARFDAAAVVCNADVATLGALCPPARVARAEPSMSGWNAVVKARLQDRVAHTVLFPTHYDEEFADVFDRGRPPLAPTVYACAQRVAHARASWAAAEPLFVMVNAPPEPPGGRDPGIWSEVRARALDRLRAADLVGHDPIVWERTPADLERRFPGTGGAIYGGSSNSMWAAFRRPANRGTVPGLYLAGGSVHPGGGLPLCALSGSAAARARLEDR